MTATEKRRRRWVLTGTFLASLTVGSAICGVYRSAHADAKKSVPVVVLPSAQPAALPNVVPIRVLSVPGESPKVQPAVARLLVQAPELLPPPLSAPEKAPPPRAAEAPDVRPIENPVPVTPPVAASPIVVPPVVARPVTAPPLVVPPVVAQSVVAPPAATPLLPPPAGLPLVPPLAPPAQPEKSPAPAQPPLVVPPDFRLQSAEPRHSVKSAEPSISNDSSPLPVSVPPALQPPLPAPGDPPMPMSFRRTALSAFVGTALVTGTMYADNDPPKGDPAATKKDLETTNLLLADLKKELADLKTKDLTDLKQQLTALKAKDLADFQKEVAALRTKDMADLKKDVDALRKSSDLGDVKRDLDSLKDFKKRTLEALEGTADRGAGGDGLIKKITALDDKLTMLNTQLEKLDKKIESTRTALASPVAKEPEKPKLGSVKLVNMYAADVEIVVNGKSYRVAPNESKTLNLAVGSFTYQLLTGGGEEKTRSLKDGEEVTLMVNN